MARDLAIDLGTANTLVYSRGRGIVLNEPTVIALNSRTHDVLAMGHEAWQMIGRTPGYIVAVRPLRKGAITDFDITQRMIRLLLQRAGVSRFNRPRVLICVPSAITEVERRAVEEAARGAGANGAYLIEQPMAAAIGAGLPIHEPLGNMVVDVGGGTTETAVISLGGIVALEAIRVGSFDIDASIQTYVRREYGIAVGERTAEEIKLAIGSAWPTDDSIKAEVRGRDLMTGLPKTVILAPEEVREAIEEQVGAIVDSVVKCLGNSPPELAQDLIGQGIHLVGGGGMLSGCRCISSMRPSSASCSAPANASRSSKRSKTCSCRAGQRPVRSSAACLTCQSRSSLARFSAASTSSPENGASARTARLRTAGLSEVARKIAGRPAGSPMDPKAATAASRSNGSRCSAATDDSLGTAAPAALPISPSAKHAASTTGAAGSSRRLTSDVTAAASPATDSSAALERTSAAVSRIADSRSPGSRTPSLDRAPRAVARTAGDSSCRAASAVAVSPV